MSVPSAGQVVDTLKAYFDGHGRGIAAAYLFGSVARETARDASDVDIGVLFEEDPPRTLEGLHSELADQIEALLGRVVDLVVLNRAPADLAHRVLRDGVRVCDRNRSARIRYEVRVRNEYFDLEPILRRYRRAG